MNEIEVKGHSGCQIDVVNENSNIYVYKSSFDPKYIDRLCLQAQKQKKASLLEYQHIRIPQIFDIQRTKTSVSIKMQYVYSKNFIEFFEQAGFEQIYYFIGALEYFIDNEIKQCSIKKVSSRVFQEKFADICCKVSNNSNYINNASIKQLMDKCKSVFDSMKDIYIPLGTCHGDLTFSNILFNWNNYYLIDFLDSFIETPFQDIVKIRQDTAYLWSQLMYIKPYDKVRLQIISKKIDTEIDQYFSERYSWYRQSYTIMQLMNILRILPYAHEERVIDHLQKIIKSLLNEIV